MSDRKIQRKGIHHERIYEVDSVRNRGVGDYGRSGRIPDFPQHRSSGLGTSDYDGVHSDFHFHLERIYFGCDVHFQRSAQDASIRG